MLEELGALYRGILLGLIIAAPIGPVGLMCIRRTIQKGLLSGIATGLGAALADGIFAAIAVFGVNAILDFIHHYEAAIRLIGGIILLVSAAYTWRDRPPKPESKYELFTKFFKKQREKPMPSLLRAAGSGFIVTLTNPLTLFGTLAVVATFGGLTSGLESDAMVLGILTGSAIWWLILCGGVSLLRGFCNEHRVLMINRVVAVCLAALGVWALFSGIRGFLV